MVELEHWEEEVKVPDQYDVAFQLTDQAKLVPLDMLFKRHEAMFEAIERSRPINLITPTEKYNWMLVALKRHAARKRMQELQRKGQADAKDVYECKNGSDEYGHEGG